MTRRAREHLGRFGIRRSAGQLTPELAARLTEHLDAGADHVAIQLITESGTDPLDGYGQLARALGL